MAFAGAELPAPFFQPARLLVAWPVFQLLLEPSLETLPARRPLLSLLAQLSQHRVENPPLRRGTLRAGIGGVAHQLGQGPQALRGDLFAPLTECARQQFAPGCFLQRRQQLRTAPAHTLDTHIDACIETGTAGVHRAQCRVLGAGRACQAQTQTQHDQQPLHDAVLASSRSFRSS
jgi:hypothetical protein